MKLKIGVIFGGNSVEHEVSIITAVQAMEYLDKDKYEVIPIYISKDQIWYTGKPLLEMSTYRNFEDLKKYTKKVCLTKKDNEYVLQTVNGIFKRTIDTIDIAFPIVHGKGVEDGSLAGYLETLGIPCVGCSVLGAALGQDKVVLKQVLRSEEIPVPDYIWFYDTDYLKDSKEIIKKINKLSYPVVVKPARLGSSIGINFVKNEKELENAIEESIEYDEKIVVEQAIDNLLELDCAVFGNHDYMETSLIGKMITNNDLLTFEDKYLSGGKKVKTSNTSSGFKIPAEIDKKIENEIYELSKKAFKVLNLKGITRFDFLVDKKRKRVYINEPNTIPGCLAFFFFTPKGKDYSKLLDDLITMTIKDYKNNQKKITTFDSNVLSTFNGSKGAKGKMMS